LGAIVTAGLAASNGEARRHVQGGAVKINDAAIADVRHELGLSDVLDEGVIKLSVGRKKHVLLKIV
jgi:tyrosyl-tRNA synthetase